MPAIQVTDLTKTYDELKAVDNVSFQVEDREVFGIHGRSAEQRIALDLLHNPCSKVAWLVRRAIYTPAEQRALFFAHALEVDPEVPRAVTSAAPPVPDGSDSSS